MEITIETLIKTANLKKMKNIAKQAGDLLAKIEKLPNNVVIDITVTSDTHIKELNNQYRGIDKATDVLSFPQYQITPGSTFPFNDDLSPQIHLGDVVISLPRAQEQAAKYENSFEREFAYLLCHGMYHLLGYDHEKEDDKEIMRLKEEKVLLELGLTR